MLHAAAHSDLHITGIQLKLCEIDAPGSRAFPRGTDTPASSPPSRPSVLCSWNRKFCLQQKTVIRVSDWHYLFREEARDIPDIVWRWQWKRSNFNLLFSILFLYDYLIRFVVYCLVVIIVENLVCFSLKCFINWCHSTWYTSDDPMNIFCFRFHACILTACHSWKLCIVFVEKVIMLHRSAKSWSVSKSRQRFTIYPACCCRCWGYLFFMYNYEDESWSYFVIL